LSPGFWRLAARLTRAFGGQLEFVLACQSGGNLFVLRQAGHGSGGVERNRAGFERFHKLGSGQFLDLLDLHHLAAAQPRGLGNVFPSVQWSGRRRYRCVRVRGQLGVIGLQFLG